jgi:predicted nucleic acid-binding protein
MILFDTNVLSELWRPLPDPVCLAWTDRQPRASIHVCVPVMAELASGIEMMPEGQKKRRLTEEYANLVSTLLVTPILRFDMDCVPAYAGLRTLGPKVAASSKTVDLMIAAIALTHDMTLATRNVRDFEGLGVRLVDPFEA